MIVIILPGFKIFMVVKRASQSKKIWTNFKNYHQKRMRNNKVTDFWIFYRENFRVLGCSTVLAGVKRNMGDGFLHHNHRMHIKLHHHC